MDTPVWHKDYICNGDMNARYDIINHLIRKNDYKSYLEIGFARPYDSNFMRIDCIHKIGVDKHRVFDPDSEYVPLANCYDCTTSDDYFAAHDDMFDIIFIDGDHTMEQVDKDLENSLNRLNPGGSIVMHDCLPPNERQSEPDGNGTVWKSVAKVRMSRDDLEIYVVDTDHGCGVVQKSDTPVDKFSPAVAEDQLTFDFFFANRAKLMNVISIQDFCERMG